MILLVLVENYTIKTLLGTIDYQALPPQPNISKNKVGRH